MRWLCSAIIWTVLAGAGLADTLRIAVTTSFQNSGLADVLLTAAEEDLGFDIAAIVVGTGQALRLAEAGDVAAVLVHAPPAEEAFVAEGHAPYRRPIMYNTFVFVGPTEDPAGVGRALTATGALTAIAKAQAPFVSRGDESGTHQREMSLWARAGVEPIGRWYRAVGAGMGTALNVAAGLNAYILTDSASWLNFGNKLDLVELFSGDPALFNQYSFLPSSAASHEAPRVKALETWLTSDAGQEVIGGYRVGGAQVFTPNAVAN